MYIRQGLGDVERAWQMRAEEPIRLAELAQRIAAGEGTLEVPDTPENRAAVANQVVDAAIDSARELQALQSQGIVYSNAPTTNDPSTEYQYLPGTTPTVDQALRELAYTQTVLPNAPAFQAPDIPAMLAEQKIVVQQQQQAAQQQIAQQAAQQQQQAQIDFDKQQAELRAIADANARALADQQAKLAADAKAAADARNAAFEKQKAELTAQLAAQQAAVLKATTKSEYDSAYNAALLAAQALKDFQAGGVTSTNQDFISEGGGGGGMMQPLDAGASNDDLSYTGSATSKFSPLLIGAIAIGAYLVLSKG